MFFDVLISFANKLYTLNFIEFKINYLESRLNFKWKTRTANVSMMIHLVAY